MTEPVATVGLAGLGRIGLPVALRLIAAGFRLRVFDIDRGAVAAAVDAGALPATSPADLGHCDLSITLLPSAPAT